MLAHSAVVGLRGWHSWQCPSTLGTISLLRCQSQPTLITFKFTELYWQDVCGHCCSPSCWETKYNADLSQGSGFSIVPVQVHFSVRSEKCNRKMWVCFLYVLISVFDFVCFSGLLLMSCHILLLTSAVCSMLQLNSAGHLVISCPFKYLKENSSGDSYSIKTLSL